MCRGLWMRPVMGLVAFQVAMGLVAPVSAWNERRERGDMIRCPSNQISGVG